MGIERIPPGIPLHPEIRTTDMMDEDGFTEVNRLARSILVKVSPSTQMKSKIKSRRKQRFTERPHGSTCQREERSMRSKAVLRIGTVSSVVKGLPSPKRTSRVAHARAAIDR